MTATKNTADFEIRSFTSYHVQTEPNSLFIETTRGRCWSNVHSASGRSAEVWLRYSSFDVRPFHISRSSDVNFIHPQAYLSKGQSETTKPWFGEIQQWNRF